MAMKLDRSCSPESTYTPLILHGEYWVVTDKWVGRQIARYDSVTGKMPRWWITGSDGWVPAGRFTPIRRIDLEDGVPA